MKKIILPIVLFIFLFPVISSNTYAQSSDCWKEYSDVKPICDQAITEQNLLEKCDQANNTFHQCLGVDKNPWKLESSKPGHLNCKEWKNLSIVGTAQNCVAPVTELFERKLWCLNSAAEISQVRSHPVDYILDFDPNSCITTEDDVRQFKASLPLTPGFSSEQKNQLKGDEENLFKKALGNFPVFIGEWSKAVSTGMNLREFFAGLKAGADEFFTDDEILIWEEEQQRDAERRNERLNRELRELLDREPKLEKIDVNKTEKQQDSPFRLDVLNGQAQIKYPGENEWKDVKAGDRIPNGSTLFTGMDTTTVLSIQNKGVVQVLPFTEVTISEWGLEQATTNKKITTDIKLRTGEIELNVEGGVFTAGSSMEVNAAYTTSSVRGTHFWVRHDDKKKVDVIGVYDGKVEVKTKDGQMTAVTPDGDKPGVAVVAQKLSVPKLAITGTIAALLIIGVIWFLKRRSLSKFGNSGRKKR